MLSPEPNTKPASPFFLDLDKRFNRFDKNSDGKLTPNEFVNPRKRHHPRAQISHEPPAHFV